MRGNIVKAFQAVNAAHQLGKRTQNQLLRITRLRKILDFLGTDCRLILQVFLPDMAGPPGDLIC